MRGSTTGGQVYHVAAPVKIADQDFICVVLVKADENLARMYVHEVFAKEKLRRSAFKTGAVAAEQVAGKRAGSAEAGVCPKGSLSPLCCQHRRGLAPMNYRHLPPLIFRISK